MKKIIMGLMFVLGLMMISSLASAYTCCVCNGVGCSVDSVLLDGFGSCGAACFNASSDCLSTNEYNQWEDNNDDCNPPYQNNGETDTYTLGPGELVVVQFIVPGGIDIIAEDFNFERFSGDCTFDFGVKLGSIPTDFADCDHSAADTSSATLSYSSPFSSGTFYSTIESDSGNTGSCPVDLTTSYTEEEGPGSIPEFSATGLVIALAVIIIGVLLVVLRKRKS